MPHEIYLPIILELTHKAGEIMRQKSVRDLLTFSILILPLIFLLATCGQIAGQQVEDIPERCPIMTNRYSTHFSGSYSTIAWSPTGREFLFDIFHNDKMTIYSVSLESNVVKPLLNETWNDKSSSFPDWSPNGQSILFVSRKPDDSESGIYKMDIKTGSISQLITGGNKPLWSPQGDRIAYTTRSGMHVMDIEGTNIRPISEMGLLQMWHPNGEQMLMQLGAGPDNLPDDVGVVDISTGEMTQLTNTTECEHDPRWFPDGQKIAYVSLQDNGNYDIFVMQADGSSPVNLTNSPQKHELHYSLSPDGEQIAYEVFHATGHGVYTQEIYVMDANGNSAVQLTNSPEDKFMPSWSPDGNHIAYWSAACNSYQSNRYSCNSWNWSINYMKPDGSEQTLLATFQSE